MSLIGKTAQEWARHFFDIGRQESLRTMFEQAMADARAEGIEAGANERNKLVEALRDIAAGGWVRAAGLRPTCDWCGAVNDHGEHASDCPACVAGEALAKVGGGA